MFNSEKLVGANNTTVGALIEELKKLPTDARVVICGDPNCYIHIEGDDSVVCIDNEMLDDCYEDALDVEDMSETFKRATKYEY